LIVSKPMTTEEISIIIKGTAALMSRSWIRRFKKC
jgi:hypothetical protein